MIVLVSGWGSVVVLSVQCTDRVYRLTVVAVIVYLSYEYCLRLFKNSSTFTGCLEFSATLPPTVRMHGFYGRHACIFLRAARRSAYLGVYSEQGMCAAI